jgi:hypothetical protein
LARRLEQTFERADARASVLWEFRRYPCHFARLPFAMGATVVGPFSPDEWHHVVATESTTEPLDNATLPTLTVSLYIDDIAVTAGHDAARSTTPGCLFTPAPVTYGVASIGRLSGTGRVAIDELAFYGVVLSPAQVAAHWAAANGK